MTARAVALARGAVLRAYRFDRYRTKEKEEDKPKLERLAIAAADPAAAKAAWAPQQAIAEGVYLARDLVSEPPNVLNPAEMAERCRALEKLGVDVEKDGAHAFYLGTELVKAEIAFRLAKRYAQDEPLDWGVAADALAEDKTALKVPGHTLIAKRKREAS